MINFVFSIDKELLEMLCSVLRLSSREKTRKYAHINRGHVEMTMLKSKKMYLHLRVGGPGNELSIILSY